MNIISPAFENGSNIPAKYTCDGDNINPPLVFAGVPKEAASLALIVDDPDSPTGTWNHWSIWNMEPTRTEITEGKKGDWVEGVTTFGTVGYGGPCPHGGTHRYFFTLYALDEKIHLPEGSQKEMLLKVIDGHILASAELMGTYERK